MYDCYIWNFFDLPLEEADFVWTSLHLHYVEAEYITPMVQRHYGIFWYVTCRAAFYAAIDFMFFNVWIIP